MQYQINLCAEFSITLLAAEQIVLQELTEIVLFFLLSPDRPTSFTYLERIIFLSKEEKLSTGIHDFDENFHLTSFKPYPGAREGSAPTAAVHSPQ